MPVAPVIYGSSDRPPRGDYARARDDYTCDQRTDYTAADHATYRRLYAQQVKLVPGLACDEFIAALPQLGEVDRIPRFDDVNERLYAATKWQLVAVPGLIPEVPFFKLLAARKFPVTDWIRTPAEFDYVVEPDIFHDLFGHVPMLFNPFIADYVQAYGLGALKADQLGACELLSRLYWYTIEFGLVKQRDGLRAYGAGILSSPGELPNSVTSSQPQRIGLDLQRCMRTRYKIDTFQQTYFVINGLPELVKLTEPDFAPLYEQVRALPEIAADGRTLADVRFDL
jgi:phenylalanine-4-hydroxylase